MNSPLQYFIVNSRTKQDMAAFLLPEDARRFLELMHLRFDDRYVLDDRGVYADPLSQALNEGDGVYRP